MALRTLPNERLRRLWVAVKARPRGLDGLSAVAHNAFGTALINALMNELARDRPIFHSEKDFQHALAWSIHNTIPDGHVHLEYKPFPRKKKLIHLDLWIPDIGVALELKYSTEKLDAKLDGGPFALKPGAPDLARYGFLKDIERLEGLSELPNTRSGFSVLLTNDPACWRLPQMLGAAGYAFRLHEGRRVRGKLAVPAGAAPGAIMGMEAPICLKSSYDLRWQDYSEVGKGKYRKFRYLAVQTTY